MTMTTIDIINKTATEVIKWQDQHLRTSMTWDEAFAAAREWYDHTDLTSPYMLSACILTFGAKYMPVTPAQIIDAARSYEK